MNEMKLPNDLSSEKAIFSIILNSPDKFIEVMDLLEASDFYSTNYQQIWQAMREIFSEGLDIDIVALRTQLKKQEIDVVPVLKALTACYEYEVSDNNILLFIGEVKNKSLLRQIIRVGKVHIQNAQMEGVNANEVITALEQDILRVADKSQNLKPIDAEGIVEEVKKDIAKGLTEGWKGFDTGFWKLDETVGGMIPTQTIIVGGYTGMGKTWMILQLLLNVLRRGAKVGLFSTEMDRKINMLRLIGNLAEVGTIRMMRGGLLDEELERVKLAEEELSKYKKQLVIYDNVYDVANIRLKAKKLKLTQGLNIVAVDFIQNLRGAESIYERMSEASIGLQQLGQELGVTMLVGSQISQQAAGWKSKDSIDFKGAGEIAAGADVALWINRVDGDLSMRRIHIRKARHGESNTHFDVKLLFPSGRIVDVSKGDDESGNVKDQLK